MTEFILELLVVVESDSAKEAEVFGSALARAVAKRRGVLNAVVADVRGDDEGES